jgi:transposase
MYHIRTTKTSSGATAIQIVRYKNRRRIIVLHIGSAHTDSEVLILKQTAAVWIEKKIRQLNLLPHKPATSLIPIDKCIFLGVRYSFIYEILSELFDKFHYDLFSSQLLSDLALIRIIEPASKLHSLELLEEYFGIQHSRYELYRQISLMIDLKDQVEVKVTAIAKKHFSFDFSLVFYDVTTLYFEAFGEDELRKPGFSKDGKSAQPQILIGLVVTKEGFPVAYEVFEGNKFEGKTIVPVIQSFQKRHNIKQLTVVADAGMISADNIANLKSNGLNYIVGARTANLPLALIKDISSKLGKKDGADLRLETGLGSLICSFSQVRYNKDKREMEKQIKKAQALLNEPGKIKRTKFLKNNATGQTSLELNDALIEKTKSLLGVKGYYTNLEDEIDNQAVIAQYHNLWHVEQAFRIAKSDLQTRPIYHFKKETVEAHILICFMALAVCKYMELKTNKSTKKIIRELKRVTDARLLNTLTGEEIIMRTKIGDEVRNLLEKLELPH